MYWNKSEKRRKNDKMAQVALNQKHNAIGREKRRWKRQKNDKLRRLEQKNLHKTKKLTWKNKEETEEKCWKQFYNIRFLKCGYKKKKKTGCRRMRNIFDSLEREHAIVKIVQITGGTRRRRELETGPASPPQNTLPVWLVKMWNEEQGGSKLFKRVWGAQAETGPGPGRANNTLLWTGASGRQWACNATRFSCRPQKIPLSQHTCRTGAKERQGVLEGGRVVNIRTRGALESQADVTLETFSDWNVPEAGNDSKKTSFQNYLLSRMWKT